MPLIETGKKCWYCQEAVMFIEKTSKSGQPYKECPKCGATITPLDEAREQAGKKSKRD